MRLLYYMLQNKLRIAVAKRISLKKVMLKSANMYTELDLANSRLLAINAGNQKCVKIKTDNQGQSTAL